MRTATAVNPADQNAFARVLGKRPRLRTAKSSTVDQFGLFVETFGHQNARRRRNGNLLFGIHRHGWSPGLFVIREVSLQGKLHPRSEVQVQLSAGAGVT